MRIIGKATIGRRVHPLFFLWLQNSPVSLCVSYRPSLPSALRCIVSADDSITKQNLSNKCYQLAH